jgi:hypothetical protein
MSKSVAASEGGHTLGCCDLGMILAWRSVGVCDGGHSADVMNKDGGGRAHWPMGRTIEINCGDTYGIREGVKGGRTTHRKGGRSGTRIQGDEDVYDFVYAPQGIYILASHVLSCYYWFP